VTSPTAVEGAAAEKAAVKRFHSRWPARAGVFGILCALALPAADAAAQERVEFPSTDTEVTFGPPTVIAGFLYKPEGAGPFPAVVGMHGCGGGLKRDKTGPTPSYHAWGEHLRAHGFAVLLVDGFTPRNVTRVCGKGSPIVSPENVRPRDAYGGLLFLQNRPFVRADRVFLMGWSHGGGTVLFTAAAGSHTRPKELPAGDFRAAIAFYPAWCRTLSQGWGWKPRVPLLALLGAADDWTPAAPCEDFLKQAAADIEVIVYPDAHHGFDSPDFKVREIADAKSPTTGGPPKVGGNANARAHAYAKVVEFLRSFL
jgi:dienelactone hydrolase